MRARQVGTAGLIAVAVFALFACGGGSGGPGAPRAPDIERASATPERQLPGGLISFRATPAESGVTVREYRWDFGDGETSTEQNPTHAYFETGSYEVTLTLTGIDGSTTSSTLEVEVTEELGNVPPRIATLSADPESGRGPLEVTFTAGVEDDGEIAEYRWDLDNDGEPEEQGPALTSVQHTYSAPGLHSARLTAVDNGGAQSSSFANVLVLEEGKNLPPVITGLSASPNPQLPGEPVRFSASVRDRDGTVSSLQWDFGDGSGAEVQNPTHSYTDAGRKTVTLVATDDDGAVDVETFGVEIEASPDNVPPTISRLSAVPRLGEPPLEVELSAEASDSDGSVEEYRWDFRDDGEIDQTTTDDSVSHEFTEPGFYTVRLTVADGAGGTSSAVTDVVVLEQRAGRPDITGISATPNPQLPGEPVTFSASADPAEDDGEIVSWQWDFGDGETGSGRSTEHSYSEPGTYTVTLSVTDGEGVSATSLATVRIEEEPENLPPAISSARAGPSSGSIPLEVNFTARATDPDGQISEYRWDFTNDGTVDERLTGSPDTSHTYRDPGFYTAKLSVVDDRGAVSSTFLSVRARGPGPNEPPEITGVSANPNPQLPGQPVNFSVSADDPEGQPLSFSWEFGDGSTAEKKNPSHAYSEPGGYTAAITATDPKGATDVSFLTVQIEPEPDNIPPAISTAAAGPRSGPAPLEVDFTAQAIDSDGEIAEYRWDFDNDGTAEFTDPDSADTTHTYTQSGLHTARLTVADGAGGTSSVFLSVFVEPESPNRPPQITGLSATPNPQLPGQPVDFSASAQDPDGSVDSYQWEFGDGTSANGTNPSHSYSSPGAYTVELTVTDGEGAQDVSFLTVSVQRVPDNIPPAIESANASPDSGGAPLDVSFSVSASDSDGSIAQYRWDFTNDGTDEYTDPDSGDTSKTYSSPGFYTARLTVVDDAGGSSSSFLGIFVEDDPANRTPEITAMSASPNPQLPGETVNFSASASDPDGSISSYQWEFGDGGTGTGQNPAHTYSSTGLYSVKLTVTDDSGATETNFITVQIKAWLSSAWNYRKRVLIPAASVSAAHTGFPVYVDLSDMGSEFFNNVRLDGSDIRVTRADGTTQVPREVVALDPAAETGELHFRASELSASSANPFFIYYGNSGATAPPPGSADGPENVWNDDYAAVWHMNSTADSTGNGNTGNPVGGVSPGGAGGRLGAATGFDGVDDGVSVPGTPSLDFGGTDRVTALAWVNRSGAGSSCCPPIVAQRDISNWALRWDERNTPDGLEFIVNTDAGSWMGDPGSFGTGLPTNGWFQVAGVYDGTESRIYKNGALADTTPATGDFNFGTETEIGRATDGSFEGRIDEVRVSRVARSDDWLSTTYANQTDPDGFYEISLQEPRPGL